MEKFCLNIPFNSVSFGQVSFSIAKEIFDRGLDPCIFPVANQVDLSVFKTEQNFINWLQKNLNRAPIEHNRQNPVFKLWHINGSLESISKEQVLMTFLETDSPTPLEINILKNQNQVLVTNNYLKNILIDYGVQNVSFCPLFFDKNHFFEKKVSYNDDRIVFTLCGKLEPVRKAHRKILKAWAKKFGNNPKFALNAAIYNGFLKPEDNSAIINQILEGKKIWNINFLPFAKTNDIYNNILNAGHIVIAASAAEGWGLPEFHSVALGKHCVGLNAHAYKEYLDFNNSVLFEPNGKIEAYDSIFFHKGQLFNQGNFFDWSEDDFISACEKAIERYKQNPINTAGFDLQNKFSVSKTVNIILEKLKNANLPLSKP